MGSVPIPAIPGGSSRRTVARDASPAERQQLAKVTPDQVTRAIAELIIDPTFWVKIGNAFLQGMVRGFEKNL